MVTTLTGENDVLRQDVLRQIMADFVAMHGDLNVERLDGEEVDYERMREAAQSLPFLAERKLVILRAPSANKTFTEKFTDFVEAVAEANDVVLLEPKLDKRLSYYKQLKKQTNFREFAKLDESGLARYLVDYAKEQGSRLSAADARLVIDRAGNNQLMLMHEIDKLLAYDPKITRASIELLVDRTPVNAIFDLLDAAFAGDTKRAMRLYDDQRAFGDDPQKILPMIVWQLHLLAIAKASGGRSAETAAVQAKISPYTLRKSMNLAHGIGVGRLRQLITELRQFDVRLKSESLNADEVLRHYLLGLSQR